MRVIRYELKHMVQRYSNNASPVFTDQETMTVYLFSVHAEKKLQLVDIYNFADAYLRSWFPRLPSYQAFSNRINRLGEAFKGLAEKMLGSYRPGDCSLSCSLLDSMPIITCSGKRGAKVAPELVDKGYCSTKSMYYFGVKLHALGFKSRANALSRRTGTICRIRK